MLSNYFADLHIHVGRDMYGEPVKIAASNQLTLTNILKEASRKKGIDMIGIIDCHAPHVQQEIEQLLQDNVAKEINNGGISFEQVTLIMGAEIEVYDENCQGPIHVLCYFPTLQNMKQFSQWLVGKMKNISLSSQRYYGSATALQEKTYELNGLFIPAHVFTPFKSMYGKGVQTSLLEVFNPKMIDAIELGLSSDSKMADQISELHSYSYVTNSDSHSLAKIGREYQKVLLQQASFEELRKALHVQDGRKIVANYGMNPKLGKYYTTVCQNCNKEVPFRTKECPYCHKTKIVNGVHDRILSLSTHNESEVSRPTYYYQVPLDYLPGLGPKTYKKLLDRFGTEMEIIHHTSKQDLEEVVSQDIANMIIDNREGIQHIQAGGGGKYGKVNQKKK